MRDFVDGPVQVEDGAQGQSGWNIKPTQSVMIGEAGQAGALISAARWWFVPHWHRGGVADWKATTFNAKIETAHEKPTFRSAWRSSRCIIPAIGYFEWTGAKGAKQPWYIRPHINAEVFFFAGLTSQLSSGLNTCTILTRAAEDQIKHLHPRMPVILRDAQCHDWLTGAVEDGEVIEHFGTDWRYDFHPVHRFGLQDDGPDLIAPDGFGF